MDSAGIEEIIGLFGRIKFLLLPRASLEKRDGRRSSWLLGRVPGRPDPDVDGVACACTCREGKVDGRDLDARGSRVPEPSRSTAGTAEAEEDQRLRVRLCTWLLNYLSSRGTFPPASRSLPSPSPRVARVPSSFFPLSRRCALTHVRGRSCVRDHTEAGTTIATLGSFGRAASSTMRPVSRLKQPVIRGNQCLSTSSPICLR